MDIPRALQPPKLADVELYYWDSFWELSTERQVSINGSSPIPASAIRHHGGYDAEFYAIIRAMDSAFMGHRPESK